MDAAGRRAFRWRRGLPTVTIIAIVEPPQAVIIVIALVAAADQRTQRLDMAKALVAKMAAGVFTPCQLDPIPNVNPCGWISS
jgi:hypothetical protein